MLLRAFSFIAGKILFKSENLLIHICFYFFQTNYTITLHKGDKHRLILLLYSAVIAEIWQYTCADSFSVELAFVLLHNDFGR